MGAVGNYEIVTALSNPLTSGWQTVNVPAPAGKKVLSGHYLYLVGGADNYYGIDPQPYPADDGDSMNFKFYNPQDNEIKFFVITAEMGC